VQRTPLSPDDVSTASGSGSEAVTQAGSYAGSGAGSGSSAGLGRASGDGRDEYHDGSCAAACTPSANSSCSSAAGRRAARHARRATATARGLRGGLDARIASERVPVGSAALARANDGPAFGGPLLRPKFYYKLVAALPRWRSGALCSHYVNISDGATMYRIGHTVNMSVHQRARRASGHVPGFVVYESVEAALECRLPARSRWLQAAPALLRLTVGGVGQRLGDAHRQRWLFSQLRPVEVIAEGPDLHLVL